MVVGIRALARDRDAAGTMLTKTKLALFAVPLLGGSLAFTGTALVQPADEAKNEITVEAPRSVAVPVERNPYTGAAVAVTTVRMSVLYGDLDLSRSADADRLLVRIRNVAREACKQLDRLLPLNPDDTCTDKAVAQATPLASAVIAAARSQ